MKDENEESVQDAMGAQFLSSIRGQFIMSQALYHAIKVLEKVPPHRREKSNIADMQFLLDTTFPIYKIVSGIEIPEEILNENE